MIKMGKPKPLAEVIIDNEVFKRIKSHQKRFLGSDKEKWPEVMGLLVGLSKKDKCYIYRAIPMTHGTEIDFEFSNEHYVLYAQIDETLFNYKTQIQGWYHTHPGRKAFFSQDDVINHLSYQTGNPYAVGLVYDLNEEKPGASTGFEIYQLDDPDKGQFSTYHNVAFQLEDLKDKEKDKLYEGFYYKEEIFIDLFNLSRQQDRVPLSILEQNYFKSNQELKDMINKAIKKEEITYRIEGETLILK